MLEAAAMVQLRYGSLVAALCFLGACSARPPPAPPLPGYELAWADEFNGSTLDSTKWQHRLPGPRRDAVNVADAVAVQGGFLTITTSTSNGEHRTGMIGTQGRFDRSFGYYEARVRFEDSPGMWSAFWSQTPTMGSHLGDPAAGGVEIDICEHRASDDVGRDVADMIQHTLHWDGYGPEHKSEGKLTAALGLSKGFHIYGLEWTPTEQRFYVDNELTWTSLTVSKRQQYLILSTEVQNHFWAGDVPAGGYGDLGSSQTRMTVDYVRYYAPKSP